MTIKIDGNFVCIGGFCFCETPVGIRFNGEAQSNQFINCKLSQAQGRVTGYVSGGNNPSCTPVRLASIERFPFSSDTNSTAVGNLSTGHGRASGSSSDISGYTAGGENASAKIDVIDKFPFASDTNGTDIAEVGNCVEQATGHTGPTSGFHTAGRYATGEIRSYLYASDTPGVDHGTVPDVRIMAGVSSTTCGYIAGGTIPTSPGTTDAIRKFNFASISPSTDVGELTVAKNDAAGNQSLVNGYVSGGGGRTDLIEKFPFAADSPSTDVAELFNNRDNMSTQSGADFGYQTAGNPDPPSPTGSTTISKFPFANDTPSTDVGEIIISRCTAVGQQV